MPENQPEQLTVGELMVNMICQLTRIADAMEEAVAIMQDEYEEDDEGDQIVGVS